MVKLKINGQLVEAQEGNMLIDVADNRSKIQITRFVTRSYQLRQAPHVP